MSAAGFARTHQCAACPWKKGVIPGRDIPGGYAPEKHRALARCDGGWSPHVMACHESPRPGGEYACVGWLVWAINEGNSVVARMAAARGEFDPEKLVLVGPQHETLTEMIAGAEDA